MKSSAKVNPNAPCACGSGKKRKQCCGAVDAPQKKSWVGLLLPLVAIVGTIGLLLHSTVPPSTPTRSSGGTGGSTGPGVSLPPPGPAPPGKVWDAAHGHYHDAAPAPAPASSPPALPVSSPAAPQPAGLTPPPDEIPEGKYWDPAHGHFHDIQPGAVGTAASTQTVSIGESGIATSPITVPVDTSTLENN
jgi:hypothetical protein